MQSATPKELLLSVWPLTISLATTLVISVDFSSSPYLDVSVQAVSLIYLCIQYMITEVCSVGLLHSEIHGSMRTYRSPWLIAVNRVLLRLPMPRHSPCAHVRFTFRFSGIASCWFSFSDHYANVFRFISKPWLLCSFTRLQILTFRFAFDVVVYS